MALFRGSCGMWGSTMNDIRPAPTNLAPVLNFTPFYHLHSLFSLEIMQMTGDNLWNALNTAPWFDWLPSGFAHD